MGGTGARVGRLGPGLVLNCFCLQSRMIWPAEPHEKHNPCEMSVLSGRFKNLFISFTVIGLSVCGFATSGLVGGSTWIFLILVTFECNSVSVSVKCSDKIRRRSLKCLPGVIFSCAFIAFQRVSPPKPFKNLLVSRIAVVSISIWFEELFRSRVFMAERTSKGGLLSIFFITIEVRQGFF